MTSVNSELGRDQFLQLLVAQLRAQDPLEPITNQEFIAQLAQFSTVEGIQQLNASFTDLLKLTQLTQGANLIGRTVTYLPDGGGDAIDAIVDGLNLEDGRLQLLAGGTTISLDNVQSIV